MSAMEAPISPFSPSALSCETNPALQILAIALAQQIRKDAKTALTYERKSTQEQSNWSAQGQRRVNVDYAKKKGLTVLGSFTDDGFSGSNFNRPGWKALIRAVKSKRPDFVIVSRYNRMSRDAGQGLSVITEMEDKYGVTFLSAEEMAFVDIYSPYFHKMRGDIFVNAEFERRVIREQTNFGQWSAQNEGRHMGQAPFGYINARDENKRPILTKAPGLARLFEYLHHAIFVAKLPDSAIAKEAKAMGFNRRGKSAIKRIRTNPVYFGLIRVKPYKDVPGKIIKGVHDGYFPAHLWYSSQGEESRPRTISSNDFYLRTFAIHEGCNAPVSGGYSTSRGKKYGHYKCNGCGQSLGSAKRHHARIEEALKALTFDAGQLAMLKKMTAAELTKMASDRERERATLDATLTKLKKQVETAEDKYWLTESLNEESYNRVIARLKREIQDTENRLNEIRESVEDEREELLSVFDGLKNLHQPFTRMTPPQKQALLRELYAEIHLEKNDYRTIEKPHIFGLNSLSLNKLQGNEKWASGEKLPKSPARTPSDPLIETKVSGLFRLAKLLKTA